MRVSLQRAGTILLAIIVSVSAGVLVREILPTAPSPAADLCTVDTLDAVLGGGEIEFSAGCTLRLRETRVITGDVVIRGNDTSFTSTSGNTLFHVEAGASLFLSDAALTGTRITTGGSVGGAIANYGKVELRGVRLYRNQLRGGQGAAIYNAPDARLVILSALIEQNRVTDGIGAGIYNAGDAYLHRATIRENHARKAAGIYNASGAQLMLTEMTVRDNRAKYSAGIENEGSLQIVGGLLVDNDAIAYSGYGGYGGGLTNRGTATIEDIDISGNRVNGEGAGIDNSGTLVITNSIIADNRCKGNGCRGVGLYRFEGDVDARHNYWGAADGPGEDGDGSGDGVYNLAPDAYTPWLTDVPDWAR